MSHCDRVQKIFPTHLLAIAYNNLILEIFLFNDTLLSVSPSSDFIMSQSSTTLRQYEAIAAITSRMLEQARAGVWDDVVTLGSQYQEAVGALRNMGELGKEERATQRKLLVRILDDDANIRQLVSPELNRLGKLLGDIRRQHTVLQAYCAPSLKQ